MRPKRALHHRSTSCFLTRFARRKQCRAARIDAGTSSAVVIFIQATTAVRLVRACILCRAILQTPFSAQTRERFDKRMWTFRDDQIVTRRDRREEPNVAILIMERAHIVIFNENILELDASWHALHARF